MDFGSESVDDNDHHVEFESVSRDVVDEFDGDSVEIRNNGSSVNNGIGNGSRDDHVEAEPSAVGLSISEGKSPGGGSGSVRKGQGLRKWKRIPRIVGSDGGGNAVDDFSRKRGMSSGGENPGKGRNGLVEADHDNSEGSVGSVNMMRNAGVGDGFLFSDASPDSRYAGVFSAQRADSKNSEDRSSKSSTAASVPMGRYNVPLAATPQRSRAKNASTKSCSNSLQSAQPEREQSESSKKQRGGRVKIEMENSHSSMESESRSSNFVFTQAAPPSNDCKQSRRSMSQEGDDSDEAHASEQHFDEEVQTDYRRENAVEDEDFLQGLDTNFSWVGKPDKKKKHGSFAGLDPLSKSMLNFQNVQEALETEVKKFKEIGKESISSGDSFDPSPSDLEITRSNLSSQLGPGKIAQAFSNSLEAQILSLKQHVKVMKGKLDETRAILELKESRVTELENIVNVSKSFKKESGSTIELQEEQYRELEADVERLFRQRIESEVEYVVFKATTQKVKFATGDQIALIEEQEAMAGKQAQILNKLGETQIRAAKLKERAEELGKLCGDVLGAEDVFTMPNKLFKVSSCFFVQLLLLALAVWFSLLQPSPTPDVVVQPVPT